MNVVERTEFIYRMYNKDEIDHLLNIYVDDILTQIANEITRMKTLYEEGGKEDTDENAKNLIFAIFDEIADRIKAKIRFRVNEANKITEMERAVGKQLDEMEDLK